MVHSGRNVVETVTSCFRRYYNRRRGYEPIPPCEADEKESGKAQIKKLCDEEEGSKTELYELVKVWESLQEEGESPEACGDRLLASFRSHHRATSFAAYKDLHYAAFFYAVAGSWRKAALTYGELADYCRKTGRELSVGSALLRSAKCYAEVEDKSLEEVVATKLALDEALAVFLKKNDLWLAATASNELGGFHMQHNELHSALVSYQRAAGYHGTGGNPSSARCSTYLADHVRYLLDNEEAYHANGELPFDDYKRLTTGYMKPTDPDWRSRLYRMLAATSIAHERYYRRGLEKERIAKIALLKTESAKIPLVKTKVPKYH